MVDSICLTLGSEPGGVVTRWSHLCPHPPSTGTRR
jgi:hypothetical protein